MTVNVTAALVAEPDGPVSVTQLEVPEPAHGQVLVRLRAAGICHTDETIRGGVLPYPMPVVLGHEGAGTVEAVGPGVESLKPGDKVIGLALQPCGSCATCLAEQPECCLRQEETMASAPVYQQNGHPVSGALGLGTFSQLACVNAASLARVETDLPFDQLAIVGCAVISGVGAVMNAGRVTPGETALVLGCGGVGLAMVQALKISGASRIVAVDPAETKRAAALACGASDIINPEDEAWLERLQASMPCGGVDVAFEAVGRGATMLDAYRAVRIGGRCILVGVGGTDEFTIPPSELVLSGKTIIGSRYGSAHPQAEVQRCVRLANNGQLDLSQLISHRLPLQQVNEGFDLMRTGQALRCVLDIQ